MKFILTKKALNKLLTKKEFSIYGKVVIVGSVSAMFALAACYGALRLILCAAEVLAVDPAKVFEVAIGALLAFMLGFAVAKLKQDD